MTLAVIQARHHSARFPGKVLADLRGETLLSRVIRAAQRASSVEDVLVAIGGRASEAIAREAKLCGAKTYTFSGDDNDVLGRFVAATTGLPGSMPIVRLCADSPLVRSECMDALMVAAEEHKADYAGYRLDGGEPAILHANGYFPEVVTVAALRELDSFLPDVHPYREHVTQGVYRHPDHFYCVWLSVPEWYRTETLKLAAIDTPYDLERVRKHLEKEHVTSN